MSFFKKNTIDNRNNTMHIDGLQYGVVKDLNDPDGLNRVKVTMPMLASLGIESVYADVVTPMAGEKYGTIWIPEVGEHVLVGFIGGRIEVPVVLGSFYNKKRKPFQAIDKKKNDLRAFKSKTEVLFQLNEKDNKPQISIETKKGIKVLIDEDKESITMTDKNAKNSIVIDMKNGAIQITADKKIEFKAGQDTMTLENGKGLALKSNSGKLEADVNSAKITAKTNFEAEGNSKVGLKGGNTSVEANVLLTLKGNSTVKIN